jgi:hypothetical protein
MLAPWQHFALRKDPVKMKSKKNSKLEEPDGTQDPQFNNAFLRMMADLGYETLRLYLEKIKAMEEAVKLLDNLLLLSILTPQPPKVTQIHNDSIAETVGLISQEIAALGGAFTGPYGTVKE